MSLFIVFLSYNSNFRQYIISQITGIVNTQLLATIEIKDIHLIGFGGIKLDEVRLITQTDTLADVSSILIDFSLKSLLKNKIYASKIVLNEPNIKLLRRKSDSTWNYDRIAEASKDTNSTQSKLQIIAKSIQIKSGKFCYIDSLKTSPYSMKFNPDNLVLDGLDLRCNFEGNLLKNSFNSKIHHLNAFDVTSGIAIQKLQGNISIDTNSLVADNLIINTNYFNANSQLSIRNYNLLSSESNIEKANLQLELYLSNYNNDFINRFTDLPLQVSGKHDIQLSAAGTFEMLQINELNILTEDIELYMNGQIRRILDEPSFNINITDSKIDKFSLSKILPEISKKLPEFKNLYFRNMSVKGNGEQIFSNFDIKVDNGGLAGKAELILSEPIQYNLNISTNNFDLASVIPEKSVRGNVNSQIVITGKGTSLNDLNTSVKINLNNSSIEEIYCNKLELIANYKNKDLEIDRLFIQFENDTMGNKSINITGNANLSNLEQPDYNFDISINSLNIKKLLKNDALPDLITSEIKIQGKNFDIDEAIAKISIDIKKIKNEKVSYKPTKINLDINSIEDHRFFHLTSDFAEIKLDGYFSTLNIFENIGKQFEFIGQKLSNDISYSTKFYKPQDTVEINYSKIFLDSNSYFDGFLNLKDLSFLNLFSSGIVFAGSVYCKLNYLNNSRNSYLSVDTLKIDNFSIYDNDLFFSITNSNLNLVYNVNVDSLHNPFLSYIEAEFHSDSSVSINKNQLSNSKINVYYAEQMLNYKIETDYNISYSLFSSGAIDFSTKFVTITADSLAIKYKEQLWTNRRNIQFTIADNFINIDNFQIERKGFEKLMLSGTILNNSAENLTLTLSDLNLNEIYHLFDQKIPVEIDGIANISINCEGNLLNPNISINSNIDNLIIDKSKLGNLKLDLISTNGIFRGSANLVNQSSKPIEIFVRQLPIYLGTDTTKKIFDEKKLFEIDLFANQLSLAPFAKFVPNISQLQGIAKINAKIFGYLPENINYSGNAEISEGYFILDNTNIAYRANAQVSFSNKLINIEKALLRNTNRDLRDGKAEISGYVRLNENGIEYIDIKANADKILVLSDASKKSLPDVYGNLVLGTEDDYIRFFGTMQEPNIEGNVVIINAELKMPQSQGKQIVKSNFTYEIKDSKRIYKLSNVTDTTSVATNVRNDEPDFIESLNFDVRAKIKNFSLLFDMGAIGEVYAKIGTKDPSIPIRYLKNRNEPMPKIYGGELELKEGSTVKIFRTMETKGYISFPTGSIENPTLDLQAKYDGKYSEKNTTNFFTVFVYITGTKEEPKIKLDYTLNGNSPVGDSKKIEEDAFILLATGRPRGVQSTNNTFGVGNLFDESINMGISQLASKSLTDLLLTTGVIQSADVKFEGEGIETAKVNFSGSIFGIGNWTIGGNIYDFSNLEISFEVPISVNSKAFNDIIFQISRSTNSNITNQLQDQKDFEMKIKLGGSW
ncbi:MAG: hypothetical protein WHV28_05145 [Bacteroidota bacterium]